MEVDGSWKTVSGRSSSNKKEWLTTDNKPPAWNMNGFKDYSFACAQTSPIVWANPKDDKNQYAVGVTFNNIQVVVFKERGSLFEGGSSPFRSPSQNWTKFSKREESLFVSKKGAHSPLPEIRKGQRKSKEAFLFHFSIYQKKFQKTVGFFSFFLRSQIKFSLI